MIPENVKNVKTITTEHLEMIQEALNLYYEASGSFLSYSERLDLKNQIYDVRQFLKSLQENGLIEDEYD